MRGKGVLITGASKGLGAALAEELSGAGARVVLVARGEEDLQRTVARIRELGGDAHALAGDVGDKLQAHRIAGAAAALVGPIELLVHNASTPGPLEWRAGSLASSRMPAARRTARGSPGKSDDPGALAARGTAARAAAPRRSAVWLAARRAGLRPAGDPAPRRRAGGQRCRHPARLLAGSRSRWGSDRDPPGRGAPARRVPRRPLRSGRLADPDRAP